MRKIIHVVFMMMVIAAMLTACSSAKELPACIYVADGDLATVIIQNGNEMMVTGPKEVNAAFTGQYVIIGNKLTLSLSLTEQEDCIFSIKDNSLILESGEWLENWIERGAVFHLSEPNIDLSTLSQIVIAHIIGGQENTAMLDNPDEIKGRRLVEQFEYGINRF